MKAIKLVAILATTLVSFSALAICPTQQTTIFFENGVNVDKYGPGGAEESKERLKEELLKEGVTEDCAKFLVAYNTNEPTYVTDFVEAFIQKSAEFTGADNFPWAEWQNTISTPDWFLQVAEKFISIPARILIETGRWVLGDQRDEHALAYQKEIQLGRNIILAAHSQGTVNAKEERLILSPAEQSSTKIVGAAAFAFPEPDESRYTTMDEDKLAIGGLGFASPPANIFLTPGDSLACQPAVPNPWYCHEFIRSYMGITPARDKIVNDIVDALPATPPLLPIFNTRNYNSITYVTLEYSVSSLPYTFFCMLSGTPSLYSSVLGCASAPSPQLNVNGSQTEIGSSPFVLSYILYEQGNDLFADGDYFVGFTDSSIFTNTSADIYSDIVIMKRAGGVWALE
jgi:hypothetical protein